LIIVVSDTSPVRALSHLNQLDFLGQLFDRVLIPPAVVDELEHPSANFPPIHVRDLDFFEIRAPLDRARVDKLCADLDKGEAEAIVLALEVSALKVLMDELPGRNAALALGLDPLGVLGILLMAKKMGLISLVRPCLDQLQNELKFFVAPAIRKDCLRLAGEL
jgi:predicted nucleic acid-binding protein